MGFKVNQISQPPEEFDETGYAPYLFFAEDNTLDPAIVAAWDFDDPDSSHPIGSGWCGAHVFENPGVYEVTKNSPAGNRTWFIKVVPFDGVTVYVSGDGSDSNSGFTPADPIASVEKAVAIFHYFCQTNSYFQAEVSDINLRFLFQRGYVYNTGLSSFKMPRFLSPIQLHFGAYGDPSRARPIINNQSNGRFVWWDWAVPNVKLMDIEVNGGSGFMRSYGGDNHLMLRCKATNTANAFFETNNSAPRSKCFVIDCEVEDSINPTYVGSRQLAVIGNRFERVQIEHVLRVWMAACGVIESNVLYDPSMISGRGNHALKLHSSKAALWDNTHKVWVSGNTFRGSAWPVAIAPVDPWHTEYLNDVVFTDNTVWADPMIFPGSKATNTTLTHCCSNLHVFNNKAERGYKLVNGAKVPITGYVESRQLVMSVAGYLPPTNINIEAFEMVNS